MDKRKQISFDIDTSVTRKILGEKGYTAIYAAIRRFMEKENWKHIEGSVYMSEKPLSNADVFYMIRDIKKQYPYLDKCIKEIHQADISNVHSLNQYFNYDGTPGQYERPPEKESDGHKREPPKRSSVREQLQKNKEAVNTKDKIIDSGDRVKAHHNRDISR